MGIRHALSKGAKFVFLVNNDTVIDKSSLRVLVQYAMKPGIGIVAPKIYYYHDKKRIWSVGAKCHPITLEKMRGGEDELDCGQWEHVMSVDFLTGCGLLISREVLQDVGLFDERFFVYYEDHDLCLRTRRKGYELLLVPQAVMWHKVSVSSGGRDTPFERYWMARSSVLFFRKHARGARCLIIVPYRAGSAIKTVIRLVVKRRCEAAYAYLRGLYDGLVEKATTR